MLQKVTDAKIETIEAEGLESIQIAVMASRDDKGINTTSLAKNLSEINGLTDINNQVITKDTVITLPKSVKLNNVKYKIKEDGTVGKCLLPVEYEQVEYIESSGEQWIDTRYKHNQGTRILADIDFQPTYGLNETPFGSFGGGGENYFFTQTNANNQLYLFYGNTNVLIYDNFIGRNIWDLDNNIWHIGSNKITFTSADIQSNFNDYIFSCTSNNGSTAAKVKHLKLYSFKIYDNNILVRNFIPCYTTTTIANSDSNQILANTKGLYDLVEGKFYTNANTEENAVDFIAGPEV